MGRALLSAAATRVDGRLEGFLPPSLRAALLPDAQAVGAFGLMGRVTDLGALAASLGPA